MFRGGITKNEYIGGNCLKREGLGQFVGGSVFEEGGVDTQMLTMVNSKENTIFTEGSIEWLYFRSILFHADCIILIISVFRTLTNI